MDFPHPQPEPGSAPPRVWPTLLVLALGLPALALIGGLGLVAGALIDGISPTSPDFARDLETWMNEVAGEPRMLLYLIVPAELGFLAAALVPASLSSQPLARRLNLGRPRVGPGVIVLCLLGTLGIQFAVSLAAEGWTDELSPNLQMIAKMILRPTGAWAVVMIATLTVLPGLCEELLCRGYLQTRLVAAWGGWRGLLLPTLFFGLVHFDVQHSLLVLPLGAWFGFVAWRAGSTWVAVACHAINNATAILIARAMGEAGGGSAGLPYTVAGVLLLACTALAVRALLRTPGPASGEPGGAGPA